MIIRRILLLLFLSTLTSYSSEVIFVGEPTEPLGAKDSADIDKLAQQVLPVGSKTALIEKLAGKSGHIRWLTLYAAPSEQSPRLWRGLFFSCFPEDPENEYARTDWYKDFYKDYLHVGRWLAEPKPLRQYAIISPVNEPLPPFSAKAMQSRRPVRVSDSLSVEEILAIHDAIVSSSPIPTRVRSNMEIVDLRKLPIVSISLNLADEAFVTLHHGNYDCVGFMAYLEKSRGPWRIRLLSCGID